MRVFRPVVSNRGFTRALEFCEIILDLFTGSFNCVISFRNLNRKYQAHIEFTVSVFRCGITKFENLMLLSVMPM